MTLEKNACKWMKQQKNKQKFTQFFLTPTFAYCQSNLYEFFSIFIAALMSKMDSGRHSKVAAVRRQPASFFRTCRSDANHFSIDLIQILRCHQSRCHGTRASPVKGLFTIVIKKLIFYFNLKITTELRKLTQHNRQQLWSAARPASVSEAAPAIEVTRKI